ncbi:SycD/LcrH family type III secretion system chaperone [Mailhella sp.]|uniref:SycD/LcrH family type III secretion system chaperone n=1 Tax=Mailhella sp. TaxID=1981029 RepID=UPI004063E713
MAEQNELTAEQLGIMMEGIQKGLSLAEVTSMKAEDIENLYALAYNLYTSGNHKDAEVVFQSLCLYNHKDVRFWMGLAGSRQANGNLKGAIDAYAMAGTVGLLKDPLPFLYAARCYIQLGEKENAIAAIKGLMVIAEDDNPVHTQCREKAAALLDLLEK